MFDDIFGFGRQFFTALVLILSAGVSVHICYGYGSRKARECFIFLLLLMAVSIQYFYVIQVSTYLPAGRFYTYDSSLIRSQCIESGKGGKRPGDATLAFDLNPCFCLPEIANCTVLDTGLLFNGTICPSNGTTSCISDSNQQIDVYISNERNCEGGQGTKCSKDQPCFPCEINKIVEFGTTRCRTCSTDNYGDCKFIPDVGPYCFISPNSKAIEACKQCCTEPDPFIINGTCY